MPNETEQQNLLPTEIEQAENRLVDALAMVLIAIAQDLAEQEKFDDTS